jgi:hypothetical protein
MKITVNLIGPGGPLDRTELEWERKTGPLDDLQQRIHAAIGAWCLLPGDTITIEADEDMWKRF